MTAPTSDPRRPPQVVLRLEVGDGRALVALIGPVDGEAAAEQLRAGLRRTLTRRSHLVVDLARAEGLDPGAIHTLVATARRLRREGGSLVVWRPSSGARAALSAYGVEREVAVVEADSTPFGVDLSAAEEPR